MAKSRRSMERLSVCTPQTTIDKIIADSNRIDKIIGDICVNTRRDLISLLFRRGRSPIWSNKNKDSGIFIWIFHFCILPFNGILINLSMLSDIIGCNKMLDNVNGK